METWRCDLRQLAHGLQASSDSLHVLGSVCSDAAGEGASEHQGNIAVGGLGVTDWESEDLHAQVRSTLAMRKERGRLIGGMGPGELINRLFTILELLQISDNCLPALKRRRQNSSLSNTERSLRQPRLSSDMLLARCSPHPRDARIRFQEDEHIYFLDETYTFPQSVSRVWATFFEEFDAHATIKKYFDTWSTNAVSKYFPKIQEGRRCGKEDREIMEEIAQGWSASGRDASEKGTHLHRQAELFLNACEHDASSIEIDQFRCFLVNFGMERGWKPFRTEWSIFDDVAMVAGQIDSIFIDTAGNLHMVDWKRVRKDLDPLEGMRFGRFGKPPCNNMLDNKFNHYACQQNLYSAILLDCYDIVISSMWLVQLHEDRHSYHLVLNTPPVMKPLLFQNIPPGTDSLPDVGLYVLAVPCTMC